MPTPNELIERLTQIGQSLKNTNAAYALLGLGSVGREQDRLDQYSDLDFFVIAKEQKKQSFLKSLSWLTQISPAGYYFQNTVDGFKFLYKDGIFCEFAIFEADELPSIPFSQGKVIWSESGFDTSLLHPTSTQGVYQRSDDIEWILGEALTNLYVGLGRYQRGEKLSAFKFVQSFALDRLIDLCHIQWTPKQNSQDIFMPDRRLENRFEAAEALIDQCAQGYSKTIESALAQLQWLEEHFEVNGAIAGEIRRLGKK
ncbi:hypothetical protein KO489_07235 [Reinekea forsetii]|nr:hypothetical protein [Reinekea forsetii]